MIYYKKIRYKIGILWLKYINRCILPKPAGLFYPKHVVLTVLQEILASILPCSTYSPTKLFPPGFGPKALSGRLKAFSTKLKRKTDNMISLFALLSIICGTKCLQIVEVCAQSKQHYQGLLSWGPHCQELVTTHGEKKYSLGSQFVFSSWWVRPKTSQIKKHPNHIIGFSRSMLLQAEQNTRVVTGNSSPHSEARPLGVCCHSQTRLRDHFCETVQTWPEWVHNPRAGTASSIPLKLLPNCKANRN